MRRLSGLVVCLLTTLASNAAEIVAWKVPLSSYAFRGLESDGVVRLKTPPEASPFFKHGDELWDLARIPLEDTGSGIESLAPINLKLATDPPLEWAVWNASSCTLVTKGDWNSIWQLLQRLRIDQLPRQIRLAVEVFETTANSGAKAIDALPSASLSWLTRSGSKFVASKRLNETRIEVDGEVNAPEKLIDLTIHVSCTVKNLPDLEFHCALVMRSGEPCLVARDISGGQGLDVRVSGKIELLDGTPLEKAVMIQRGSVSESLAVDALEARRHRIGNGWLITSWFDPEIVAAFKPSGHAPDKEVDPFEEQAPVAAPKLLKFKEVSVPEAIQTWFPHQVWDLSTYIKSSGINMTEGDFAGYAPGAQRIFLFSGVESEIDKFEQLVSPGCIRSPAIIKVTMDGESESMLISRSGSKSVLSRSMDGTIIRSMDLEPTIDETGELIDLRLEYLDDSRAGLKQEIKSALTLREGEPSIILSGPKPDGGNKPLRVTAEIERLPSR